MEPTIRFIQSRDIEGILAIYKPFIETSPVTFEEEVPSTADFRIRLEKIASKFPFYVLVENDSILGYAYATTHREREAYRWLVETSVYLAEKARGKGYGTRLYNILIEELKNRNFKTALGGITLPNPSSVGLHQKCGFREFAVYEDAGWKAGSWHSVMWLRCELNHFQGTPPEPIFRNCMNSNG